MGSMHVAGMSVEAPPTLDGFEVLDATHRQTLAALERLQALVSQLGDGHGGADAPARASAAEIVRFFSATSRQHHLDEETHVFPRLKESADPAVVQAVLRLQQDHGWLEEDWRELSPLLAGLAAGQTWVDVESLRRGVEIFTALSHDHMALEESLIYPQARAHVPPGERRAMGREMAARRRGEPDGP
jgi:iron-sulfur cluster repair protein YtfE (RIC family)